MEKKGTNLCNTLILAGSIPCSEDAALAIWREIWLAPNLCHAQMCSGGVGVPSKMDILCSDFEHKIYKLLGKKVYL